MSLSAHLCQITPPQWPPSLPQMPPLPLPRSRSVRELLLLGERSRISTQRE
ncbi:Protein of unknown function [Pyronema omphalodes CBS 100304]|uniref:Uncharacterized protein n=1 Tax=Pyronema omphalodes (strain CBS 100304) TaxID=1076935 RepID=U4L217_PYROM|nr:Protein of unknown function [Pyronema omphalodes CBS 100304]